MTRGKLEERRRKRQRETDKICKENKKRGIKSSRCETWENTNGFKGHSFTPEEVKFFDSIKKPSWEIT